MIKAGNSWFWRSVKAAQITIGALASIVGITIEISPGRDTHPFLLHLIDLVQQNALTVFLVLGGLWLIVSLLLKFILKDPWIVEQLQEALDSLQEEIFKNKQNSPKHAHRVTLFRHHLFSWQKRFSYTKRKWCKWPRGGVAQPFSGWLLPVMRSWHTDKNSQACFLAPDDARRAEGIAGQCWATRKAVHIDKLPPPDLKSEQSLLEYSRLTHCDIEWLRRRLEQNRQVALSMCVIPIEVEGRLWGVIVIDSIDPRGVKSIEAKNHRTVVGLISKLLRRL